MATIGVVLADDHAVLREGLAALIDHQDDMTVLAHAGDGRQAVDACAAHTPDVAIIDLSMPAVDGVEATRLIHQACPATRVVVLTMHDNARHMRAALAAGAAGYVVKELASRALLDAIRAVHAGQLFVRMSHAQEPPERTEPERAGSLRGEPSGELSRRERQVLRFIAQGYTHQETADALGVGKKSVDSYRARLQHKLGLTRRSQLVRYALETGVLSAETYEQPDDDGS